VHNTRETADELWQTNSVHDFQVKDSSLM